MVVCLRLGPKVKKKLHKAITFSLYLWHGDQIKPLAMFVASKAKKKKETRRYPPVFFPIRPLSIYVGQPSWLGLLASAINSSQPNSEFFRALNRRKTTQQSFAILTCGRSWIVQREYHHFKKVANNAKWFQNRRGGQRKSFRRHQRFVRVSCTTLSLSSCSSAKTISHCKPTLPNHHVDSCAV